MEEVSKKYISGYIDGSQPVKFGVNKTEGGKPGYGIRVNLVFHTHTGHMRGFLDELFTENRIRYNVSSKNEKYKRINVNSRSATIKLLEKYKEYLISERPIFEYLKKYHKSGYMSKKEFSDQISTIERLLPSRTRNNSLKYTSEYFEDRWDVTATPIDFDPEIHTRELSDEYVAGLLDGTGIITVGISKSQERDIGYSFYPRVEFAFTDAPPELMESLENYFSMLDISYSKVNQQSTMTYSIQKLSGVKQLLNAVNPHLIRHFYTSNDFCQDIIPRVENGENKNKQGFVSLVKKAEESIRKSGRLRKDNNSVKYTSEYFENEFDVPVAEP